jgi:MFS family permease
MSRTLYDCPRISRRVTHTLFAAQSLSRAAFVAAGTVSALVAVELGGQEAWAGVPAAVLQITGAFAALAVAGLTERIGRRRGLALGLAIGAVGAGVSAAAIAADALLLFLSGLTVMGAASAAMLLSRFAAAEVEPPERRGRAISNIVIGGTAGSIAGPLVVGPSGRWAVQLGMNELSGAYLAALVILAVAALSTWIWLRPDPRDVSRKMAAKHPEATAHRGSARPLVQILVAPAALVAVSAMALGQMVMVLVMVITSVHMQQQGHTLTGISLVISSHSLGMFAFSWVSGRLTDRWGRGPVILAGTGMLALASMLAPMRTEVLPLAAVLFVLGLGWNFCYVAGSTLLSDQLSVGERAMTQGANELLMGVTTAAASLGSGVLHSLAGYATVCMVGVAFSLLPMGLTAWWMSRTTDLREILEISVAKMTSILFQERVNVTPQDWSRQEAMAFRQEGRDGSGSGQALDGNRFVSTLAPGTDDSFDGGCTGVDVPG